MRLKKYLISGIIAVGLVTGTIFLAVFYLFPPPPQQEEPKELFNFDLSITSHENDSVVKSCAVVLRGNTSGSPDINEIVVNGKNAISLESNFKKWGVILNLIHGSNQILIDIIYNITYKIENASDFCINADTNPFPKDLDRPDSSYQDMNNDGIDGMCDNAIFVSKGGSDLNSGDIAHPMLTIIAGVAKANESGKKDVYISEGTYNGSVVMVDGISIYGGYRESDLWSRDVSTYPIINSTKEVDNHIIGVKAHNIHSPTYLDTMEIITGNYTSGTSCGIWCYNISDFMLSINNCIIHSGNGGDGVNGPNGVNGASGSAGSAGVGVNGGSGGSGVYNGGSGGAGGIFVLIPLPGNPGLGGAGPSGGSGGILGPPLLPGLAGGNGGNGGNGGHGAVGDGNGTIVNNFWYGNDGHNGGNGGHGSGGGGGGGGGSGLILPSWGGGGGGGGGGGQLGIGGIGGTSGGGSIGILLVEANITSTYNTIFTGHGGAGGSGGIGGSGGSGGAGGIPLLGGLGGKGGNGGKGGDGGAGGGGAGGVSYGIYCYNSNSVIIGNLYTIGSGGSGGSSTGNNGVQGESGDVYI